MKQGQKGQVAILVLIILLIVGVFIINIPKSQDSTEAPCAVGEKPIVVKNIEMPGIKNPDGTVGEEGGADPSVKRNYRLVRVNVPVDVDSKTDGPLFVNFGVHTAKYASGHNINGELFDIYYPNYYGESTLDDPFESVYEGLTYQFRFHQEGFIYLVRLNEDGTPQSIRGIDRNTGEQKEFYLVDLYQESGKYEAVLAGARGYQHEDIFKCQSAAAKLAGTTISIPTPSVKGNTKQLQMGYFKIQSGVVGFNIHCKPAIYLYPEKKTEVSVKVDTKGFLTYTDPLYPVNGWKAIAYPNGRITVGDKDYEYLYYESKIPDKLIDVPKEGFVVAFNDLPELFGEILPRLGLSAKQTFDFITYWEKGLPKSPFYFVGVLSEENINNFEPLTINPKPATIIRVRLYFQALDKKIEVITPKIIQPEKKGFTVVEWGGMIKTDKNHPFTCSQ